MYPLGEIGLVRAIINHNEDKQNNKMFKAVQMCYLGNIIHEYVTILSLNKYIIRVTGGTGGGGDV